MLKICARAVKGEEGLSSGENARLMLMCSGFDFRTRRRLWIEFVVGVLYSATRGTPVSPSPQKPTFPNSNSILNARAFLNEFLWTPWCSVGKQITYLHIYIIQAWLGWSHGCVTLLQSLECQSRETFALILVAERLGAHTLETSVWLFCFTGNILSD